MWEPAAEHPSCSRNRTFQTNLHPYTWPTWVMKQLQRWHIEPGVWYMSRKSADGVWMDHLLPFPRVQRRDFLGPQGRRGHETDAFPGFRKE